MSSGEPTKSDGQFHSTKGSIVEAVGNATGSDSWTASGKKEHAAGETETKGAEAKGYAEGAMDRAVGIKDSLFGSITGDTTQETSGDVQQKKGEAKQAVNS